MLNMQPTPNEAVDERLMLRHCELRLAVHGTETAWVKSITGNDADTALVLLGLSNLTLYGPLPALRDRLQALVGLLDSAAAHPERWAEIPMRQVSERRWVRNHPHPFVNRPV